MAKQRVIRYDLLECANCDARTYIINLAEPPKYGYKSSVQVCKHEWWSKFTFTAIDNGPGLAPDQISAFSENRRLP